MRFRPRFTLRTLLLIVAAAAVLCWAYWVGWPRWQVYRLESALRQLKAGVTANEVMQLRTGGRKTTFIYDKTQTGMVGLTDFVLPNWICCVYYRFPNKGSGPMASWRSASIKVLRLPRVPSDYLQSVSDRESSYVTGFMAYLAGYRTIPYNYELIHSDPVEPVGAN